jgi:Outer membrane protein beta-barrel domain
LKPTKFIALAFLMCSCAFSQSADLSHGKVEIRGFGGGINAGNLLLNQPAFSAGVEGAFGLNRIVALTGYYAFDHLGTVDSASCFSSGCSQSHERRTMHEFMGGVRFSIPNRSRITPYGDVNAGGVLRTETFSLSGSDVSYAGSFSVSRFAVSVGAGANYRISRRTGINVDVRGTAANPSPESTGWIVRTTAGYYFRF